MFLDQGKWPGFGDGLCVWVVLYDTQPRRDSPQILDSLVLTFIERAHLVQLIFVVSISNILGSIGVSFTDMTS